MAQIYPDGKVVRLRTKKLIYSKAFDVKFDFGAAANQNPNTLGFKRSPSHVG